MKALRRRGWLALALAAFAAAHARAAEPSLAEAVKRRLADAPVLRGEFEQRKLVQGFRHPLVSRGSFVVARGRGVLWATREPFASTMALTRERMVVRGVDGAGRPTAEVRDDPALKAVNELLLAVVAGDLGELATRFRIEGQLIAADAWRLQLVPTSAALARWVQRVELEGDRHVRALRIAEAGGDETAVRFTSTTAAQTLTSDEAARLE